MSNAGQLRGNCCGSLNRAGIRHRNTYGLRLIADNAWSAAMVAAAQYHGSVARLQISVWEWWCGGLDWLAGDEDGEDQAGQGDDEHRGEGDGEGLALGEVDGEQGQADQGGAESGSQVETLWDRPEILPWSWSGKLDWTTVTEEAASSRFRRRTATVAGSTARCRPRRPPPGPAARSCSWPITGRFVAPGRRCRRHAGCMTGDWEWPRRAWWGPAGAGSVRGGGRVVVVSRSRA